MAQVSQHEADGLVQHLAEARAAGHLPGVQVQPGEQGVVVQHLLEVGHDPLGVHRVAAEAAAQVVVDPPRGHGVERVDHHVEHVLVAAVEIGAQQHLLAHGLGELGGPAEAAPRGVVLLAQGGGGLVEGFRAGSGGGPLGIGLDERSAVERLGELVGLVVDILAAVVPHVLDPVHDLGERRHLAPADPGVVGAAVERAAVGGHEHGHGPSAPAGERLHRLHVDGVHVGALFPVHLDVHEQLVHHLGRLGVFERLVGHDVAPVAGRIAH